MRLERKKVKINELADILNVKKFTIKTWEKEFGLSSNLSDSKFYGDKEIAKFALIKELICDKKLSMQDAKRELEAFNQQDSAEHEIKAAEKTEMNPEIENISQQLLQIKEKLIKLREIL